MATSNKMMGDILRNRRKQMADAEMGMDEAPYAGPMKDDAAEETAEVQEEAAEGEGEGAAITVAAPGEPSTGDQFEYEPMIDMPGAWVVYPPGVPCDDTEYRVQMNRPAGKNDFDKMQQALDDAGATSESTSETPMPELEEAY